MTKLQEKKEWSEIEQLEDGMILTGGEEGIANMQAQALANRTVWLKENQVEKINGKTIVEKKVDIEAKDILAQSGKTVQAELDQKSDTNHTHDGGGLAPEIKAEDAGKVLAINQEGTQTEWKMLSGNPVGTIIAWAGLTPPAGHLECSGQILKRDIYKDLFKAIGTIWGTTAEDNFKLPDFTSAARFLRSRGDGLEVGTTQEDAIRNVWGDMGKVCGIFAGAAISGNGAYSFTWSQNSNVSGGSNSTYPVVDVKFDSSRVTPTADENRPKNAVVMYCIKAVDEYINPTQVDLAKVDQQKANREDVKELAGTRLWVSGEYQPVANAATTVVHGLKGIDPLRCKCDVVLKCLVASGGYSVGDIINGTGVLTSPSATVEYPLNVSLSEKTIQVSTRPDGLYAVQKNNGAHFNVAASNWRYVFRIWY